MLPGGKRAASLGGTADGAMLSDGRPQAGGRGCHGCGGETGPPPAPAQAYGLDRVAAFVAHERDRQFRWPGVRDVRVRRHRQASPSLPHFIITDQAAITDGQTDLPTAIQDYP